ncbi:MAG: amidohydrolase [Alphaproteobacteria bacterium]|nr:amidohydrolase [Alphaproteobacteria bacterium]
MMYDQIKAFAGDLAAMRRDLHMHPELAFEEHRTSKMVAEELSRLGFGVTTGVAGTGVIGTLVNGASRKVIGIRADMDGLPIQETTGLAYASRHPGKMHACGHDGHTAMLLGLARYLAETYDFNGTVHLIFQPAEEDISGAHRMVKEGVFKRFACDQIFALHNIPGESVGQVRVRPGAITASIAIVDVVFRGVGGHGAFPHQAIDPIVAASSAVVALQTVVSRNLDPLESAAVTVGAFNGGVLATAIPETVSLKIGVRTCSARSQRMMAERIPHLLQQQAASFGCVAEVEYGQGITYPPCINDVAAAKAVHATAVALGQNPLSIDLPGPYMFAEDFAFLLEEVPGAYFGIGNGTSKNLHESGYDFNDELLLCGTHFWVSLVQRQLPV